VAHINLRDGATLEFQIGADIAGADVVDVRKVKHFRVFCADDVGGGSPPLTVYEAITPENELPSDLTAIADADWKPSNTFGTAGEWATFVEDEYNAAPALACSARLLKFVAASAATGVISAK